jgi:hypothetical protein
LDLQDFSGSLTLEHTLIGDKSGNELDEAPLGAPDANGNLIGGPVEGVIDPRLGPLTENGGPTWTHALLPDSPAIDMGDPEAVAGVDDVPLFDQRGRPYARIVNGRIDMGALERSPADNIDRFCQCLGESDPAFDLNGDGVIDLKDLRFLVEQQLGASIGDANLDGVFDSSDLVLVFQVGQYEDGIPRNSTWSTGDWNCNREFDSSDMVAAFQAGGYEATAAPAALPAATVTDDGPLWAAARTLWGTPRVSSTSSSAGASTPGAERPSQNAMALRSVVARRWAHERLFAQARRTLLFVDLDGRVGRAVASLLGPPSAEEGQWPVLG